MFGANRAASKGPRFIQICTVLRDHQRRLKYVAIKSPWFRAVGLVACGDQRRLKNGVTNGVNTNAWLGKVSIVQCGAQRGLENAEVKNPWFRKAASVMCGAQRLLKTVLLTVHDLNQRELAEHALY